MGLTTEIKGNIVERFQRKPRDTGSPEVQVALLSAHINVLTDHLKSHKKDFHSRRGLIGMVSRRRTLLSYLKKTNPTLYTRVVQDLGIRG